MQLRALVEEVAARLIAERLVDVDETPGLSPCFVRAMIQDRLAHLQGPESTDRSILQKALIGEIKSDQDVVSASPSTRWLCTRYIPLPECSDFPQRQWELHTQLILLRGGVQELAHLIPAPYFGGQSSATAAPT